MAKLEKLVGIAQTEIIVIPIIDVSGSMSGEKIGQVNSAMESVPDQLRKINDDSIEANLLVAPLEFSNGARWVSLKNEEPMSPEAYRWVDVKANGVTDLGEAFKKLAQKLTVTEKGGWMKGRGGAAPVLILLSDGGPTDDYRTQLESLKKRGWFRAAIKFAISIGDDADDRVLAEFTGNPEAVIKIRDFKDLSSIVRTVIVSASKSASQSASVSTSTGNTSNVVTDNSVQADEQFQDEVVTRVVNDVNNLKLDSTDDLF